MLTIYIFGNNCLTDDFTKNAEIRPDDTLFDCKQINRFTTIENETIINNNLKNSYLVKSQKTKKNTFWIENLQSENWTFINVQKPKKFFEAQNELFYLVVGKNGII